MREFSGRVAVVTGGASGIGFAMASRFAGAGMRVVLADVESGALEMALAALRDSGRKVEGQVVEGQVIEGQVVDVSNKAEVEALAEHCYARFGSVNVLCNNAGVGGGGLQSDLTVADWDWVLGVNLHGVVHGIASFLPRMRASGEPCHIVNTASMAGHVAGPGMGPYNASKYAVVGLSESLAKELAGTNVGVSVLCPGWVRTNILDSRRNRPDPVDASDPSPDALARSEFVRSAIEAGLSPSAVADLVLDAIVADRFWIFTHPEMLVAIRMRVDAMLAGENPVSAASLGEAAATSD